jgi:cation:H+ antiporter
LIIWLAFIICTSVIVYSGTKLARYGDMIAEKTGLGRSWIGLVLMASVTSLPELATGLSSVTYAGVPDIAAGDVFGSCVFNMFIFALIGLIFRPLTPSTKEFRGHVLAAGFGILLLGIVVIGLLLGSRIPSIGWIGYYSPLVLGVYFIAMKLLFSFEKRQQISLMEEKGTLLQYEKISTRTAVFHYSLNAVLVIISAVFLPMIGKAIAETTGLGQTFVGNVFMAVSTSLPEVVVSVAAMKIGAINLAVGNLFGSNIFNILILAFDDLFFLKGPILSFVNLNQAIPALSAMAMNAIALIGLTYQAEKGRRFPAWDSLGIMMIFVTNLVLLYVLI